MADSTGSGFPTSGMNKGHLFFDQDEGALWEYVGGPPRIVSSWKLLSGKFNEQPNTSLWGEAQAGAMWTFGGVYYGWDGVQIIQITNGAPVSLYNYRNSIMFQDDFISNIDTTPWYFINGVTSVPSSETNHYGLITRDNDGSGTRSTMFLSDTDVFLNPSNPHNILEVVRVNTNDTATGIRIGAANGFFEVTPTNGIYFEKLAADTNWFCVTRSGGVQTRIDSTVAVDTNFNTFAYTRNSSGVQFAINNVNVGGVINTNIPTTFLNVGNVITGNDFTTKSMDIDYVQMNIYGIVR